MADPLDLPPAQLTAHQPPALLVEAVLACDDSTGRGRLRGPLDALQLAEGCAQVLACLMGVRMRRQAAAAGEAGRQASGMLVGVKDIVCPRPAAAGEAVEVAAVQTHALGPFQLYAVTATAADGAVLMTGEWKTMQTEQPQAAPGGGPEARSGDEDDRPQGEAAPGGAAGSPQSAEAQRRRPIGSPRETVDSRGSSHGDGAAGGPAGGGTNRRGTP
jgi:hypothetical protein